MNCRWQSAVKRAVSKSKRWRYERLQSGLLDASGGLT
jgi:hypothetical protein